MVFTEPIFAAFFALVFGLYYLPALRAHQLPLLLVASFGFYAYGQPYLLLLLIISATLSAAASHGVLASETTWRKRAWAFAGVGFNLAILGFSRVEPIVYGALASAILLNAGPLDVFIYFQF
jgi:D-alanyl-lipoteichoic acid acyltransferase DltB (MBOAT superfamily)